MAITLAQAKVGMADKVVQSVIDNLQRSSRLLDLLTFDDAVSPTGGSTLVYGYQQLKTPSTAGVRNINEAYTANEAIREAKTAELSVFGGSYQIDRVIAKTSGAINEVAFQQEEKIKATKNGFHYFAINGVKGSNKCKFDGLKALLTGTDRVVSTTVDISTAAKVTDAAAFEVTEILNKLIAMVEGENKVILCNGNTKLKLTSIANKLGYFRRDKDDFGHEVQYVNDIEVIDLGKYYDPTTSKAIDVVADGEIYVVDLSLSGFHGVSPTQASAFIESRLPDFTTAGTVKEGDVEMVAGVVLKSTLHAACLTGLKVAVAAA